MRATLMNFGDANRIIHDLYKQPVVVGIGRVVSTDIDPAAYNFIAKAQQRGDTLVIVPEGTEMPPAMMEIMQLLTEVETGPYDDIVRRLIGIVGKDNIDMRPTHAQIRATLKGKAQQFLATQHHILAKALYGDRPPQQILPKDDEPTDNGLRAALGLAPLPGQPDIPKADDEDEENEEQTKAALRAKKRAAAAHKKKLEKEKAAKKAAPRKPTPAKSKGKPQREVISKKRERIRI